MDDPKTRDGKPAKDDTSEYSSTKAPETRPGAEERDGPSDTRLQPGGPLGAEVEDVGMSSLDRDEHPTAGTNPGQTDIGSTRTEE